VSIMVVVTSERPRAARQYDTAEPRPLRVLSETTGSCTHVPSSQCTPEVGLKPARH
jgi:hypothetical protein